MTLLPWFLATALLLVTVLAAELASRWWIRRRSQYYVLDPGLRLRLHPDRDVFPQLESSVRFDVNSDGERGDDVPRSRQGLCRMLVVGGSQPEGYLLDQDTAWPGALQRLLDTPENRLAQGAAAVHVGNIARSGVGSEGLVLILQRLLPRYPRLNTIIILVGASDVLRWLELGAPSTPLPPVRASDVFRCHPELTFGWRPSQLALFELIRRLRHRWLRPVEVNPRAGRWIARARAMRAQARTILTAAPDPSSMLAHFDRHFRRAIQMAQAQADRVIVVRQPWFEGPWSPAERALMWHGGVGQAWRENVTKFYSLEVLSSVMARLDSRAASIADEMGIEQFDLMPIVDKSANTYYDFFHATPAGARIIAAAVADVVLRRAHPLPAAAQVETRRQKIS